MGAVAAIAIAGVAASIWRDPDERVSADRQDIVELRPFAVIDGKEGMDAFARQTHASLKRILTSNQVSVVDGGAAAHPSATARKGTEFVLSGVVEKSGGDYAVTVYFDNRAGQTLWSHRLARPLTEADALREAVGANAANVIGCSLKQRAKAQRKPSVQAFMIYFELCDWRTWAGDDRGLATAERLASIAPDDAYGHGLAAFISSVMVTDRPDFTQAQIDRYAAAARKAAARALELDPKNDDALLAKALLGSRVQFWLALDAFRERQQEWLHHPWGLRQSGRLNEAIHHAESGVANNPLSPDDLSFRAVQYMQAGHHEAADRMLAEVLQVHPDHPGARFYLLMVAAFYGHPERALALLKADGDFLEFATAQRACWRAFLEARGLAEDRPRAATVRAACEAYYRTADESGRDHIRRMLAALGDVDGVFELMRTKSWAWTGSTITLWYPEMAAVRRDERFMPLIVKSGLPEYWLKSENWPDFCRKDVLPYDCKSAAAQALKNGVAATRGP